jgi:hypothetical protein
MKSINLVKKFLTAAAIASALTWQASAIIAYDSPSGITVGLQGGGPWILGNEFQVNSPISVTSIGAFNSGAGGFGSAAEVAIYSLSAGTWSQVPGTFVSFSGGPGGYTYVGDNAFSSIAPVSLGLGTYAIVAANYGDPNPDFNANTGAGVPRTTFQTATTAISMTGTANGSTAFYDSGTSLGLSLPGSISYGGFGGGDPTFGAGTFDFAVPEASQFALAGIALLGLVYFGRCYVLRTKLA